MPLQNFYYSSNGGWTEPHLFKVLKYIKANFPWWNRTGASA
jgi:hypothetical protein